MAKVIDHTPLIHPVRNASEIVKRSLGPNFESVNMSHFGARWVSTLLNDIEKNRYYGLTIPSILASLIYTNDLLRAAGAYHELKGHIDTLIEMAWCRACSLGFHVGLLASDESLGFLNAFYQAMWTHHQRCTQELIATAREITSLIPYRQKYGSLVKNRIQELKDLNEEGDWVCDRRVCYHRNAVYIGDFLKNELELTPESIMKLAYGFCVDAQREGIIGRKQTVDPDVVLSVLLKNSKKIRVSGFELISSLLDERLRNRPSVVFGSKTLPISKTVRIKSQGKFFNEGASHMAQDTFSEDRRLSTIIMFPPLRDLITQSFIVITKKDVELYYKKRVTVGGSLGEKLMKTFVDIKLASLYVYPFIDNALFVDFQGCPSRNGSQCDFRKRKEFPRVLHTNPEPIVDEIVRNDQISKVLSNARSSAEELFKTIRRKRKSRQRS